MDTEVPSVGQEMPVYELCERLARNDPRLSRRQGTLVLGTAGGLVAILTCKDLLLELQHDSAGARTAGAASRKQMIAAHPNETLSVALDKMLALDIGRLPVVEGNGSRRVVGYLGRTAILSARKPLLVDEHHRQSG